MINTARPKLKDNRPVSVRLDVDVFERLDEFCKRSGQPKTVAIERAITAYIDDYDAKMAMIEKIEKKV